MWYFVVCKCTLCLKAHMMPTGHKMYPLGTINIYVNIVFCCTAYCLMIVLILSITIRVVKYWWPENCNLVAFIHFFTLIIKYILLIVISITFCLVKNAEFDHVSNVQCNFAYFNHQLWVMDEMFALFTLRDLPFAGGEPKVVRKYIRQAFDRRWFLMYQRKSIHKKNSSALHSALIYSSFVCSKLNCLICWNQNLSSAAADWAKGKRGKTRAWKFEPDWSVTINPNTQHWALTVRQLTSHCCNLGDLTKCWMSLSCILFRTEGHCF